MTGYRFRTYATDRQQKHNFRITKRAETQKFQLFHAFSIPPCLRYLHTRIPNRHIQRYACANRVVYTICDLQQHAIALREIRQPACVLLRCLVVNAQIVFSARYRHRKRTDRLTVSQKTVKRLVLHILRQIHIPVIAADRMRTDISHLSQCRTRYRSRLLRHCPPGIQRRELRYRLYCAVAVLNSCRTVHRPRLTAVNGLLACGFCAGIRRTGAHHQRRDRHAACQRGAQYFSKSVHHLTLPVCSLITIHTLPVFIST